jgi:hypothetical protein
MKLLTIELRRRLLQNGELQARIKGTPAELDFFPVVKLFTPDANCTWLLTELDPENPDIAFGLCDLGMGFPELGNVSISELEHVKGPLGLSVERDLWFSPHKTLLNYAAEARSKGGIVA